MYTETKLADSGMAKCLYHHKSPLKAKNATVRHTNAKLHYCVQVYYGPLQSVHCVLFAQLRLFWECYGQMLSATAECNVIATLALRATTKCYVLGYATLRYGTLRATP